MNLLRGADIDNAMILNARLEAKTERQKQRQETLRMTSEELAMGVGCVCLALAIIAIAVAIMLGGVLTPDENALTRKANFDRCMDEGGSWITSPSDKEKYACLQPGEDLPSKSLYEEEK